MVFCSVEFFVFFLVVAAAYWALPWRPARVLLTAASASYLGYAGWQLAALTASGGGGVDAWNSALAHLPLGGELFWVAGVVVFGSALAWRFGHDRGRVWLLLAASFYFYASWNPWLAGLIFASTILDYFLGRGVDTLRSPGWRRALVGVSVAANLGLLCFFKYTNFFLASLQEALHSAGASTSFRMLEILAPIGVSFYTFEAISYIVDVYRGRMRAERNLANFMLFILFFPHLVAGPIVRARDFLPQIRRRKRWDWPRVQLGVGFFLMGLFKKWVIADRMALFADPVFAQPGAYRTGAVWMAVLAYTLQIYGDFSGYTDMAIGTAHLLGYRLAKNFDMPYLSANMAEFWQRWHISLSTWLRDYLFFPLGGSRGGRWKTYRNLLIVMVLCGLWHGASWIFVAFGFLQGLYMAIHRTFHDFCEARPTLRRALESWPGTAARVAFTFFWFMMSLVVFRSQSFQAAGTMFCRLAAGPDGLGEPLNPFGLFLTVGMVLLCHLLARRWPWPRFVERLPAPVLGVGYALLLTLCLVLAPPTSKPFIYFQF